MSLAASDRVLDVGAGFGVFTGAIAEVVSAVVAVESDEGVHRQAHAHPRVERRLGAGEDLPLSSNEWGGFDVAVARFVLESTPHPERVVTQMAGAVRPGGRVILIDDDHETLTFWPPLDAVARLWAQYLIAFNAAGHDALVGRKLPALLLDAGIPPTKARSLHFGVCAGEPSFGPGTDRLRGIFAANRAALPVSDAELLAASDALDEWSKRRDATAWGLVRYAEGVRVDDAVGFVEFCQDLIEHGESLRDDRVVVGEAR